METVVAAVVHVWTWSNTQPARNLPTRVNKKGLKLRPMVPYGENLLQLVDYLKSEVNTYKEKIKRREAEQDLHEARATKYKTFTLSMHKQRDALRQENAELKEQLKAAREKIHALDDAMP